MANDQWIGCRWKGYGYYCVSQCRDQDFFLIANVEVRGARRFIELQNAGQEVNMRDLIEDIRLRDEADKVREIYSFDPSRRFC